MSVISSAGAAPSSPVAIPFRMNAGGPAYTDSVGSRWSADAFSVGGSTYTTSRTIAGTIRPVIYRSERWGMSAYRIPVANGTYRVRLQFAEVAPWAGRRIFSVTAEGAPFVTHLDLNATVGAYAAHNRTRIITVRDNVLDLGFTSSANYPKLSALEILRAAPPATRAPSPSATTATPRPTPTTTRPPTVNALFSGTRPGTSNFLRSVLPAAPRLDAAATDSLNRHFPMTGTDTPRTNPTAWTHNVYYATKADPSYEVASLHTDWGCSSRQADGTTRVHIPDTATKSRPLWSEDEGTDGWLTVVNTDNRTVTNMWRARKNGSTWTSDCVGTFHLDGSGWNDSRIAGVGTGAGHAAGAGVITREDLDRGYIDHALIVASNSLNSGFRAPANKSDGKHGNGAHLQEGMRLQLNPAVDCANLPGAGRAEKMICRAAQVYGFYIGDQTGCCGTGKPYWGGVTFHGDDVTDPNRRQSPNTWEDSGDGTRGAAGCAPISATCGVWAHYGIKGLPSDLSRIPWKGNMRVLAQWNGS